ncbi:MAG UNVERIFIED_CONTAM: hypothetical protein LVQ98_08225 [Rickettsiaceae bacterium]
MLLSYKINDCFTIYELLILSKIRRIWKINKDYAWDLYTQYPKVKGAIVKFIPEIKDFGLFKLTKLINENQKLSNITKNNSEVNDDLVLKECNNIINLCKLEEIEGLVLLKDQIKDELFNINSGPILVARKNVYFIIPSYDVSYDILYYVVNGTTCILDYTRSFIADDTMVSVSNVPRSIRKNYNNLYRKKQQLKLPQAIKIPYKHKVHDIVLKDNYA